MRWYGELLKPSGSKLALLESTFNAENFIRRLSWSNSSNFDAVHSWNVWLWGSLKSQNKLIKTPIWASRSFKVIDSSVLVLGTPGKLVSSAYYDAQQLCLCLSAMVLLPDWMTVAETAHFEGGTQIWCIRTENSLNLGGQSLHRWNLRLMPKFSYTGCPGLSWMVSVQFTLIVCIAA